MFPSLIPVPIGYQPEGVATGHGPVLCGGSLASGAIYRVDLRTGEGELLYAGEAGRAPVGLLRRTHQPAVRRRGPHEQRLRL
jgi:hypothetical protein